MSSIKLDALPFFRVSHSALYALPRLLKYKIKNSIIMQNVTTPNRSISIESSASSNISPSSVPSVVKLIKAL